MVFEDKDYAVVVSAVVVDPGEGNRGLLGD